MSFNFLASYIAIWVLVLFQGLLVLALLRQLAELRRLLEVGGLQGVDRLPVGSLAPDFAGFDLRSGRQVSGQSLSGTGGVMLFLSPECTVCKGLADSLRPPAVNDLPPTFVFCQGGERACARFVKRLGPGVHLLVGGAEEVATRYRVTGSPTAVVVDGERKVRGYGHPQNVEDLKRLVTGSLSAGPTGARTEVEPPLAVFSSGVTQ
jgi:hypothetical protein